MSSSGLEFPDFKVKSCADTRAPAFSALANEHEASPHQAGTLCHHPFLPVWLLHRLLESQLQSQKRSYENEAEALRGEIQSLKEENNRQQQLLAQNLQLPPEARIEASLQHEITRLTNENLVRAWLCKVPHTVILSLSRDGVRKIEDSVGRNGKGMCTGCVSHRSSQTHFKGLGGLNQLHAGLLGSSRTHVASFPLCCRISAILCPWVCGCCDRDWGHSLFN